MALDLQALTAYTNENRDSIIAGAVAGAKSAQTLNLQVGYKSAGAINIMDTSVTFQADVSGRTPNDTTTFSQRILTVGAIKIEENIDVKALNAYWTQHALKAGSADDVFPFEQEWTDRKVAKISETLEKAIWQGDTVNTGSANLRHFDGLLKHIDADSNVIDGNTASVTTAITKANVIGIMDDVYEAVPLPVLESGEVKIFCGFDVFRTYTQALKDSNLYHYSANNSNFEIEVPGTDVKIVALQGLSGTSRIIAGKTDNFVLGTDLENEEEEFDVWYSKEDKVVKFDAQFKYGTQIAFPEQIVEFTLGA